jgi:hypothetical protein
MRLLTRIAVAAGLPMALIAGTALPGAAAVTAQKVLTADQIASRANADMKKAKTYRVWGPVKDGSKLENMNVTRGSNGCEGTFSLGGPPISFVQIGATTWLELTGRADGTAMTIYVTMAAAPDINASVTIYPPWTSG